MVATDQAGGADDLFAVRTAYFLGNYQQCIQEAQSIRPSNEQTKVERDVYVYRSYVMQKKYSIPLEEIRVSGDLAPALLAVRMLADYLAHPDKRDQLAADVVSIVEEHASDSLCVSSACLLLAQCREYDSALRFLNAHDASLECLAMTAALLMHMNRYDLAKNTVQRMKTIDDDSIVTQMAGAFVNMALGREQAKDALFTLQELTDKYGATPLLLNAVACCQLLLAEPEQADKLINQALQRDSNDPETLVNAVVTSLVLHRPAEISNRYVRQLKESFAQHPWTLDMLAKEAEFDRLAAERSRELKA